MIFDGPMKEAKDPAEILYARVKKPLVGSTSGERSKTTLKGPTSQVHGHGAAVAGALEARVRA